MVRGKTLIGALQYSTGNNEATSKSCVWPPSCTWQHVVTLTGSTVNHCVVWTHVGACTPCHTLYSRPRKVFDNYCGTVYVVCIGSLQCSHLIVGCMCLWHWDLVLLEWNAATQCSVHQAEACTSRVISAWNGEITPIVCNYCSQLEKYSLGYS